MTITCGKCKADGVTNKGRGLCPKCYLGEYTANRRDKHWKLDRKARTGRFTPPRLDFEGKAPAGSAGPGGPGGKDVAVQVPFAGEDLGLYQRLAQEARFNRRSLAGQILFTLECELGTDRGRPGAAESAPAGA